MDPKSRFPTHWHWTTRRMDMHCREEVHEKCTTVGARNSGRYILYDIMYSTRTPIRCLRDANPISRPPSHPGSTRRHNVRITRTRFGNDGIVDSRLSQPSCLNTLIAGRDTEEERSATHEWGLHGRTGTMKEHAQQFTQPPCPGSHFILIKTTATAKRQRLGHGTMS
ncbi:hypothetical protein Hypma_007004 [Hypsizygus marmoreus]|uniref:Uncharacterized protein n=1 Tax=Hypsizygus marmoreus TaxID=39966 RepID=A0A369K776_HYPMA|nr:hypothetical protein Hypma_007004 [Hypsizygus marmoreus]